jgi:outer membrane cobalamin receptor
VEDFEWATGIFNGPVEAYGVMDLSVGGKITSDWTIGLDIANTLDKDHYEVFGGDLLGRRALVSLTYSR